ncbi:hypothetical protein NW766_010071 [Fusarium irregulare]|uniref:Uncharacterized protein n=1 Tax=Fusarium irregulare TaxID=2494466 RepID=A0A9W8PJX0_9HYPO|nr:hypothetical protein NW766_010071 [Fusarium irregulare]
MPGSELIQEYLVRHALLPLSMQVVKVYIKGYLPCEKMHEAVIRRAQRQFDLWAWIDERRGANNTEEEKKEKEKKPKKEKKKEWA